MPVIGITKLKPENTDDAWRRIAIHQALFGSFLSDNDNSQPMFLTKSDVERHIGIETEGKQLTFEEFCFDIKVRKLEAVEAKRPSFVANGNRTLLQAAGIEV